MDPHLCPCGHHAGHHTEAGCNGGRYRPCACPLRPQTVALAGTLPAPELPRHRERELTASQ
jgi:hypothetical protein